MAKEWGRYKVNVNAGAFGPIHTRLTEGSAKGDSTIKVEDKEIKVGANPDLLSQMERMIPLGRVGTPEEAAGAVYLFCKPESTSFRVSTSFAAVASRSDRRHSGRASGLGWRLTIPGGRMTVVRRRFPRIPFQPAWDG